MLGPELIRALILITLFGAVVLGASILVRTFADSRSYAGAVNRRLKLIAQGVNRDEIVAILRKNDPDAQSGLGSFITQTFSGFHRKLMMAAVPFGSGKVAMAMVLIFALLLLGTMIAARSFNYVLTSGVIQLVVVFAATVAVALPVMIITFLAERRRKRMQEQFPVALDIFVRALRSGHPVSSAIELVTHEMTDPIGSEFGLVSDEVSYGAELTDALNDMAERWDLDDIRMFVVSLNVQNETGGNLAEVLDNLSRVIRERAALYLKVRALSSEGRMTGWLLTALPIFTFVVLFTMNPGFYLGVAQDPIFFIGFPVMIAWYLVGVVAIRKMIDLKV